MSYANPDALVSTDWLADHLDDSDIRIVEVDEDREAYAAGHIPGAIAWNWTGDLQHPVQREYLDQDALGALMAKSGIGADTTVVLYGGNNNWFASYAFWLLKYRGFDNVRLLNGGRIKWEKEGRDLSTDLPQVQATDFRISGSERPKLRAFRDEVIDRAGRGKFVDVRSPAEFSGEKLAPDHLPQEQPYVGGHVPGAANIPWSKAANEDGTFKDRDALKALYDGEGIKGDEEVIVYCRIGERSSHSWFVLTQLLGYDGIRNYDGSWTEYGSLVGVPVERG